MQAHDGRTAGFLSPHALETLRALTARLVPGPPEDRDPGALEALAAEAIDSLLGALTVDPPRIHAGGPFSDRAGAAANDFSHFVPLDALGELGWRIRLEGSRGLAEREFAGPVRGLQEIYTAGLAALDARSGELHGFDFAQATGVQQDEVIAGDDDQIGQFVATVLAHTLDAVYGPPEYGGNHGLVGWTTTGWPGDSQPRGFTYGEVAGPDPPAGESPGSHQATLAEVRSKLPPDAGWRSRASQLGSAGELAPKLERDGG
jgi:Gluconate 2-dehydrogenase subunit 3